MEQVRPKKSKFGFRTKSKFFFYQIHAFSYKATWNLNWFQGEINTIWPLKIKVARGLPRVECILDKHHCAQIIKREKFDPKIAQMWQIIRLLGALWRSFFVIKSSLSQFSRTDPDRPVPQEPNSCAFRIMMEIIWK